MKNQYQDAQLSPNGAMNLVRLCAESYSICILPFIRENFGIQAFSFSALGAVVLMVFVFGLTADYIFGFMFAAWWVAIALNRAKSVWNFGAGRVCHSRYWGDPKVALMFCKRDFTARVVVEPLMVGAIGYIMCDVSEVTGNFLMIGAAALLMCQLIERFALSLQVQRLRDSMIEAHVIASKFRGED